MTPTKVQTKDIEKSSHLNMKAFTTDTPHIKRYIINPSEPPKNVAGIYRSLFNASYSCN